MALQGVQVYHYTQREETTRGPFSIVEEACRILGLLPPTPQEVLEIQQGDMGIEDFFAFKEKIILNFTTTMYDPISSNYIPHTFLMITNPSKQEFKRS